jgi:hypothetical protein
MERHAVAMATAEQYTANGIVTMPTPFAVLAGFSLNLQADRRSALLREPLGWFPVSIQPPAAAYSF